eukprot:scaffold40357_cov36-Phaeocystis_antarctica.AAC.1
MSQGVRLFCASAFTGRLGVNGRCCSPDMPECIRLDLVSRVSCAAARAARPPHVRVARDMTARGSFRAFRG